MLALCFPSMELKSKNSTFKSGKTFNFSERNSLLFMNVATSSVWMDPNFSRITFSDKNFPIVLEIIWRKKQWQHKIFLVNAITFFGLRLSVMMMRLIGVSGELLSNVDSMKSSWYMYLETIWKANISQFKAYLSHLEAIGAPGPPEVRMVARWILESSASSSDPSFSLLSKRTSQPSQPKIVTEMMFVKKHFSLKNGTSCE